MRAALLLAALALGALATPASAQIPGVNQEVLARGQADYAAEVDGAADIYVVWVRLDPGAVYLGWHTHPGVTWITVTRGEVAVYGPDACGTAHPAGTAFATEADTDYDLRNEGADPVEMYISAVIRAGERPTILADPPDTECVLPT